MKEASYWIEKLKLEKHPEGGWFKETYRSGDVIEKNGLPHQFSGLEIFALLFFICWKKKIFQPFTG